MKELGHFRTPLCSFTTHSNDRMSNPKRTVRPRPSPPHTSSCGVIRCAWCSRRPLSRFFFLILSPKGPSKSNFMPCLRLRYYMLFHRPGNQQQAWPHTGLDHYWDLSRIRKSQEFILFVFPKTRLSPPLNICFFLRNKGLVRISAMMT